MANVAPRLRLIRSLTRFLVGVGGFFAAKKAVCNKYARLCDPVLPTAVTNEHGGLHILTPSTPAECGTFWNNPLQMILERGSGRKQYCSTMPDHVIVDLEVENQESREKHRRNRIGSHGSSELRKMPLMSPSSAFSTCRAVLMELGAGDIATISSNVTGHRHSDLGSAADHAVSGAFLSLSSLIMFSTGIISVVGFVRAFSDWQRRRKLKVQGRISPAEAHLVTSFWQFMGEQIGLRRTVAVEKTSMLGLCQQINNSYAELELTTAELKEAEAALESAKTSQARLSELVEVHRAERDSLRVELQRSGEARAATEMKLADDKAFIEKLLIELEVERTRRAGVSGVAQYPDGKADQSRAEIDRLQATADENLVQAVKNRTAANKSRAEAEKLRKEAESHQAAIRSLESMLADAEAYKLHADRAYSTIAVRLGNTTRMCSAFEAALVEERHACKTLENKAKEAEAKHDSLARALEEEKSRSSLETSALKERLGALEKERQDALAALNEMQEVTTRVETESARLLDGLEAARRARETMAASNDDGADSSSDGNALRRSASAAALTRKVNSGPTNCAKQEL